MEQNKEQEHNVVRIRPHKEETDILAALLEERSREDISHGLEVNTLRSNPHMKFPVEPINRLGQCNSIGIGGEAIIHIAAASLNRRLLEGCICLGADINIKNSFGQTAFYIATYHGFLDTMKRLRDAGADSG